ncbi:MAG TPA: hypothetical protein VK586_22740 [Streptosporangiaceae bacterium]|nr:hypothetical protein [Streptosporangiaceae bacterium]
MVAELEQEAERALAGVGDASLGEWREWTGKAFHIRRRLSEREQQRTGLVVADIRRTPEALQRAMRVRDKLIFAGPDVLAEEIGNLPP